MDEPKIRTLFIIKYWNTKGIMKLQCEDYAGGYVVHKAPYICKSFHVGTDAFETIEEAHAEISLLKEKKIKGLQKIIEKIKNIKINTIKIIESL